jgi:hypothetical protein
MTEWRLEFRQRSELPKLAWLAEVQPRSRVVTVTHGSAVETASQWCVEGTWDAPFDEGNFHRSENLFGSGVRIDGERLCFSSSVALVDRLFHVHWNSRFFVSNSLIQMLARTGARLNPHHNYRTESFASGCGIKRYPNEFQVLHPEFGRIFQEYHCNLIAGDDEITRELRSQTRHFESFAEYLDAVSDALAALRANYQSPARRYRVDAFSTTSAGYDSTATTALARALGVSETFTIALAMNVAADEQDSGVRIAERLGLTVHTLSTELASASSLERYFLAATVEGSEIFLENAARHIAANCAVAVLYTGYYGGVIWKRYTGAPEPDDDIRRGDVSGLNLSEVRLAAGFINLAVPFMYSRNIVDIARISSSREMQPWSLGQDYDKPIPRRLLESAGVPRNLFGQKKRAQVRFYSDPRSPALREQFRDYVGTKSGIPRSHLAAIEWLHGVDYAIRLLARRVPTLKRAPRLMRLFAPDRFDRRSLMFVWAANGLAEQFVETYRAENVQLVATSTTPGTFAPGWNALGNTRGVHREPTLKHRQFSRE